MAGQPRCAGDLDATEDERLTGTERVRVVTEADARAVGGQDRRRAIQIGRQRHLEVVRLSGHHTDGNRTGLQQGGLIGERVGTVRREPGVGRLEDPEADPLWRLGDPQPTPVDRPGDDIAIHPFDRVGDGHDGDRGAVLRRGIEHAPDQDRPDRRTRAVVDEDDAIRAGPAAFDLGDPCGDRLLAAAPAGHDDRPSRHPGCAAELVDPARSSHDDDRLDPPKVREPVERPGQQRPAADRRGDLVDAPHSLGRSRRDDDEISVRMRWTAGHRSAVNRLAAGRRSSVQPRSGAPW